MDIRGTRKTTSVLVVTIALLAAPQGSRADLAELLRKLHLSTYPRVERPPEFLGQTTDGRTVSLSSQEGKVILLNFWATWCRECRMEMPAFERLNRDFRARGLAVLGVNVREPLATVQKYATDLNLTFPLILDPKGEVYTLYGVIGLPTTFLIGRDGKAVALGVGLRDWQSPAARALVGALLAEPAR